MKRILITGADSYIGSSFEKYMKQWPEHYIVNTVDLIESNWREKSFAEYDVVFHVAGIAHIKETKKNAQLYYEVNCDLAVEVADKAKNDGARQFIFISTMSVYGKEHGIINNGTPLTPNCNYGKSKLQAENCISHLNDQSFNVAILRPPMVYGYGCKGNYPRLAKLAMTLPFFPDIQNERSMIYINNLCEFVRILVDKSLSGIFFPQNIEYCCTTKMVYLIAKAHEKTIKLTKLFNPIIRLFFIKTIRKVFGNLVYDKSLSKLDGYNPIPMDISIQITENK